MQLHAYLAILRRAWLVLLLLPLVVGGFSMAFALARPPVYQATTRLLITVAPRSGPTTPLPALDDGATWTATEYILDDLPFVLTSATFAEDVRATLAAEGYQTEPAVIQAALSLEVTHRAVYLTATADEPGFTAALLPSAVIALQQGGLKYWGRAASGGLAVVVLDPPGAALRLGSVRDLAREVGVRVVLAFAAGIGLAFLAYYLDDRLRSSRQAEAWLGARVLGVIPKE